MSPHTGGRRRFPPPRPEERGRRSDRLSRPRRRTLWKTDASSFRPRGEGPSDGQAEGVAFSPSPFPRWASAPFAATPRCLRASPAMTGLETPIHRGRG